MPRIPTRRCGLWGTGSGRSLMRIARRKYSYHVTIRRRNPPKAPSLDPPKPTAPPRKNKTALAALYGLALGMVPKVFRRGKVV